MNFACLFGRQALLLESALGVCAPAE